MAAPLPPSPARLRCLHVHAPGSDTHRCSSKSTPKQSQAPPAPKGKKSKKPVTDDDVLTFEQKKDLSDTISKLDGAKLEKVIQIIHDGVPEIRDVRSLEFIGLTEC